MVIRTLLIVVLFLVPSVVDAQTDSLVWLRTTIEQVVGKKVSLVKPCDFFLEDSQYLLEGLAISHSEYSKRLEAVATRETEDKKEQQRIQYDDVYFGGRSYVGTPQQIMNMFKEEKFGWHKEKNHDRSAIVVLSDGIHYIVNIYNFQIPKKSNKR